MKKQIRKYSVKLWLTVVGVSFILFQVPLYYVYYSNLGSDSNSYWAVFADFLKNWVFMITLLSIPCFLVFRMIRALYQPYWSARGFKLALLLVSEFVMSFFLLLYFCIYSSNYIIPTGFVIAVFVVSYAISVYVHKYRTIQYTLYKEHEDRE